jgi:hypothetical protein
MYFPGDLGRIKRDFVVEASGYIAMIEGIDADVLELVGKITFYPSQFYPNCNYAFKVIKVAMNPN